MDRIWQWAWHRYGPRYSWAVCAVAFLLLLQTYLVLSFVIVAFEDSDRYIEVAAVSVVAVLVLVYVLFLPGLGEMRLVEQWAAGHEVDRATALDATYTYGRDMVARVVVGIAVWAAVLFVVVGAIAGASGWRLGRV
jgi:adenylate cyclase